MTTTVAFVLASYTPDAPAGMERATANLAAGLRSLGHRALIVTAAPQPQPGPDILSLGRLPLRLPADDATLRAAIRAGGDGLAAELAGLVDRHGVYVVVYVDALWGLGRAAIDHPVRSVLAAHVLGHDEDLAPAIARADQVIAPSPTVIAQAADHGYDTTGWAVVPNALPPSAATTPPPGPAARDALRTRAPIRAIARVGATKNMATLLATAATRSRRPLDATLAAAGFEDEPGAQAAELALCRALAATGTHVTLHDDGLPWAAVPGWLAGASAVVVPSLRETFGLVALEALSVGTPVVAFAVDNLPALIGTGPDAGGLTLPVAAGVDGLLDVAEALLAEPVRYGELSRAAYYRSRDYLPTTIAAAFLEVVL